MAARPSSSSPSPGGAAGPGLVLGDDPVAVLEAASWALAAVVGTLRDALTVPLGEVLAGAPERTAVLEAAGLVERDGADADLSPSLRFGAGPTAAGAVEARLSSLRRAASAAAGNESGVVGGSGWADQGDDVLLSQGRASAGTGNVLATRIAPQLDGLAERLDRDGSRVLDVGTGVAALAVSLARAFPHALVFGIDILQRALDLARIETEGAPDVADRVSLRRLDVAELTEQAVYELIWLPVPYLTEAALTAALPRLVDALAPGGWIVAGTDPAAPDDLGRAVARWNAVLRGGNAYDADLMAGTLTASGLRDVRRFPTVPGGPVLVAARRPES